MIHRFDGSRWRLRVDDYRFFLAKGLKEIPTLKYPEGLAFA
jgi:hypothetical protein